MFHKEKPDYNRRQYDFYTIDKSVPEDHFLRQVDSKVDFDFVYDLVEDTYSPDNGRPSLDPVMLVKIPLIQCFYGIRSMRQTMKEIEVNVAYRWFLGLTLDDKVPILLPMERITAVVFKIKNSFLRFFPKFSTNFVCWLNGSF